MLVLSDLHGEFGRVVREIEKLDIRDQTIIQVGDFGVGFVSYEEDRATIDGLSDYLGGRNLHMYAIRGNHDNPALFTHNSPMNGEHITLLPDYSVLEIEGHKVLCVGGAISVDRGARQAYGHPYWPEEPMVWDEARLRSLDLSGLEIALTHNCPSVAPPYAHNKMVLSYAATDPTLIGDLVSERGRLDAMYEALKELARPAYWFFGHHHAYSQVEDGGTIFVGLPEHALIEIPSERFPLGA